MPARSVNLRLRAIALEAAILASLGASALTLPLALAGTPVADAARSIRDEDVARELNRRDAVPVDVQQRIAAIRSDVLRVRVRPWEGDYYRGDGLGANIVLSLSLKSGVAATWHGCMGLYGANEGTVNEQADGSLRFGYHHPNADRFAGFPERVLPVQWGDRRYLLEHSQFADFIDAINRGDEPRVRPQGRHLLAEGDEGKRVEGLPALPAKDLARIRTQPMTARVAAAIALPFKHAAQTQPCERSWRLLLKTGGHGTLAAGDILHPELPQDAAGSLVLENVSRGHAVGVVTLLESDCDVPDAVPDRGWEFSTGAYDPVAANQRIEKARAQELR